MVLALIFSVGTVCAEDADIELASEADADVIGEVNEDTGVQDTLTSDESDSEIASPEDGEVLGDAPVYVKPGKVTNRYVDGVIYSATFYDDDGNPLKDAPVFCGVDDKEIGINGQTNSNGVAIFPLFIKNGNHKLYLYNPLDANNSVVDNIKVFDVITGGKNINMYYDGGNTYKVRVYGDNGKPVKAGEKVTFAVGKKLFTRKTDKKGFAKLKINEKPGVYDIGAKYKDFVVLNRAIVKPVLKPINSFKSKKVKPTVTFKVKFLGKNKKNKLIKVKFNKKTYKTKTNKRGIAIFKLKTPKKVGIYNVLVTYKKTKITQYYSKYYT